MIVISGRERIFPHTDLYHLGTVRDAHVASLVTYYPNPGPAAPASRTLDYVVADLPWSCVNIARFQIDRVRSNAYVTAGGSASDPFPIPDPARIPAIRQGRR